MPLIATLAAMTGKTGNKQVSPVPSWADISGSGIATSTDETFDGFSGSITVSVVATGSSVVSYRLNGTGGYTIVGSDFSMSAGESLQFQAVNFSTDSGTITVRNETGDQDIDVFNYSID